MRPGYEYAVQQRSPAFETNDSYATVTPAETRAGTMAGRRASWAGRGQSGRGRAAMPQRAAAASWQDDVMQMRTRLLELGA